MKRKFGLVFCAAILLSGFGTLFAADQIQTSTEAATLTYDKRLTAISRILAGIVPQGEEWKEFEKTAEWNEHHGFLQSKWTQFKNKRAKPVETWRDQNIVLSTAAGQTMNYPFSGPDFLNAYLFFPNAERYVFYSLEAPGKLPDLQKMSDKERGDLFKDIRDSLSDIFRRQYFITKNMIEDFKTPYLKGNTCTLLIFMAYHQNKIVSLEPISVNAQGELASPSEVHLSTHTKAIPGIKIVFLDPTGTKQQELVYFSLDVSDKALVKHPEFLLYLDKLKPCVSFMKAASYLLHSEYFPAVRKKIIETSDVVVQDDSGMPLRFFKADQWDIKLYGKYTKPVKDFDFGFQKDLDALYQKGPVEPLPFSFGYHWWDNYSNVMVAKRKNP